MIKIINDILILIALVMIAFAVFADAMIPKEWYQIMAVALVVSSVVRFIKFHKP